jgi:hypothetical protein
MLTASSTGLASGDLTDARRRTVRYELEEADKHLGFSLTEDRSPDSRERLDFVRAALRDALRWVEEGGDAAAILVALEDVNAQEISDRAARHIVLARVMLRHSLG